MGNDVCSAAVLEGLDFHVITDLLSDSLLSAASEPLVAEIKPSTDLDTIRLSLDYTTEMRAIIEPGEAFPLEVFDDVSGDLMALSKEGGVLSSIGLYRIGRVMRLSRLVKDFLSNREDSSLLNEMTSGIGIFRQTEKRIEKTVNEEGDVLDSASGALRKIRKSIRTLESHLRKRLSIITAELSEKGIARDDNPTIRGGRYVVPVRVEHKRHVKGVMHDTSSTGTTVFIEPLEIIELSNQLREVRLEESKEIERILKEISGELHPHLPDLMTAFEVLRELDVIRAKSLLSIQMNASPPEVTESGAVRFISARNPALEQVRDVVPLSYEPDDEVKTVVITGPNAGGKTVAMKAVGLLTLMAQSGLHIPASEESVAVVFDSVFVDIGDRQNIKEDLSTFSAHVENLREIIDKADDGSLVLIDEIGTGTDPSEGAALAAAFLEEMTERGVTTIVTTHHGGLKAFAHETDGVLNCSMEFDAESLSPTYRFVPGLPGSSYAFEISRRLGISESVVNRAARLLGEGGARLESLITNLERERKKTRDNRHKLDDERKNLEMMTAEYEEKIKKAKSIIKGAKAEAASEAARILEETNAIVEKVVKEIKEKKAATDTVKHVKNRLQKHREKMMKVKSESTEISGEDATLTSGDLKKGMTVRIVSLDVEGLVDGSPDGKGEVAVVVGNTRVRVAADQLVKSDGRRSSGTGTTTSTHFGSPEPREINQEINLRGMRADEAETVLDKYIDDALLAGFHSVDVIHGRGTGILRKVVSGFLESHPRVRGYHTAGANRGGIGVTVVELE